MVVIFTQGVLTLTLSQGREGEEKIARSVPAGAEARSGTQLHSTGAV